MPRWSIEKERELYRKENYGQFLKWRKGKLLDLSKEYLRELYGGGPITIHSEDPETLEQLIKDNEGKKVEFKETMYFDVNKSEEKGEPVFHSKKSPLKSQVLKAITGLFNSGGGGNVIIGVKDGEPPEIVGLERDLEWLDDKYDRGSKDTFVLQLENEIEHQIRVNKGPTKNPDKTGDDGAVLFEYIETSWEGKKTGDKEIFWIKIEPANIDGFAMIKNMYSFEEGKPPKTNMYYRRLIKSTKPFNPWNDEEE